MRLSPEQIAAIRKPGLPRRFQEACTGPVNAPGHKPHYYLLNTRAADFWYQSILASVDEILFELEAFLLQGSFWICRS